MQFGPGLLSTFLYYFSSTGLVFALVTIATTGASLSTGLPQQSGLAGGLLGGMIGAYFNRTTTLTLPAKSEKKFLNTLEPLLTKLGYEKVEETEDGVKVYQRQGFSKFLSGRVFVQFEEGNVAIASRAIQIRALKKLLK